MCFIGFGFGLPLFFLACQTSAKMSKTQVTLDRNLGPHVDERVRLHQDLWLKGLVLDPNQTGIDTLVVIGDSYPDTGNLFQRSRVLGPPQIFWRSRRSDGPIWVDYMQGALGWTIRNYTFVEHCQAI